MAGAHKAARRLGEKPLCCGGNPPAVDEVVDDEQTDQREPADFMERHADRLLAVHQHQQDQHNCVQNQLQHALFRSVERCFHKGKNPLLALYPAYRPIWLRQW
ncbi:hypothetical protein SDC9_170731 [bioreactor metagenome]|uniref:Uncharacterized protein n=1 Tax=bioreactor metagenome TaxID=1076179 RepID=A0A645GHZ2_9ZZZZ